MRKISTFHSTPLHYEVSGSGRPVVWIHGFGEDSRIWESLRSYWPKGFLHIVPDLPGSGLSPLPAEVVQTPSIDILADSIAQLLWEEAGNGQKAILIGHSMGGYAALSVAERYPELVHAFYLFHSTAMADSAEKAEARRKSIAFIRQYGAAAFIAQTSPNLFAENFRVANPAIVDGIIARYSNFPADALVWYYEAMIARPDRQEVLKKASFPIGFTIGGLDKAVPAEQSLQQASLPGISFIQVLENVAHMGMIEDPGQTGPFLEKFLLDSEMPGLERRY